MNAVPSQEKTLQVLIYEASSNLVPLLCGILLKGSSSKIKFNFLETDQGKYKQAENHCEEVKSFGSKMLTGVRLTKYPKKAFKDIDCAIILPQNFTDNSDNPIDGMYRNWNKTFLSIDTIYYIYCIVFFIDIQ